MLFEKEQRIKDREIAKFNLRVKWEEERRKKIEDNQLHLSIVKQLAEDRKDSRYKKDLIDFQKQMRKLAFNESASVLAIDLWDKWFEKLNSFAILGLPLISDPDLYCWLLCQNLIKGQLPFYQRYALEKSVVYISNSELLNEKSWEMHYNQLTAYLLYNRSYLISENENQPLYLWMRAQWYLGAKIDKQKYELLDQLHFWTMAFAPEERLDSYHYQNQLKEVLRLLKTNHKQDLLNDLNKKWDLIYKVICEYHVAYHTNEAEIYPTSELKSLVEYIRNNKDLLSYEQLENFNAIGFIWKVKHPTITRNIGVEHCSKYIRIK